MKIQKYLLLSCLLFWIQSVSQAQFEQFQHRIDLLDSIATFGGREKIFIHHDKPQYQLNDTLWLKGYVVSGAMNKVNDSSRIAYLEFIDAGGQLVKRSSTVCDLGLLYSNITLGDQLFSQGVYTLRAYTNRMRSFGDSLFFQSEIKLIDPKAELWNATVRELSLTDSQLFLSAALKSYDGVKQLASSRVVETLKSKNKEY